MGGAVSGGWSGALLDQRLRGRKSKPLSFLGKGLGQAQLVQRPGSMCAWLVCGPGGREGTWGLWTESRTDM